MIEKLVIHRTGGIDDYPPGFSSQVDLRLGDACSKVRRPRTFPATLQRRIDAIVKKYGDFGMTHKPSVSFIKDSLVVNRVFIPVISLYGHLELYSCQRSLLVEAPEMLFDYSEDDDFDYNGLMYYPYNIPCRQAAELGMEVLDLWADSASKVIGWKS